MTADVPARRLALSVPWVVVAFEIALVALLAVPVRDGTAQAALLLGLITVVTAAFAIWVADGSWAVRAVYALVTGAVAAALGYFVLVVIDYIDQESGPTAFFVVGALWLVAAVLAALRLRGGGIAPFAVGTVLAVIGLVALPVPASWVASARGGDALAGLLVLAAPVLSVVALAALALGEVARRRFVASGEEAS